MNQNSNDANGENGTVPNNKITIINPREWSTQTIPNLKLEIEKFKTLAENNKVAKNIIANAIRAKTQRTVIQKLRILYNKFFDKIIIYNSIRSNSNTNNNANGQNMAESNPESLTNRLDSLKRQRNQKASERRNRIEGSIKERTEKVVENLEKQKKRRKRNAKIEYLSQLKIFHNRVVNATQTLNNLLTAPPPYKTQNGSERRVFEPFISVNQAEIYAAQQEYNDAYRAFEEHLSKLKEQGVENFEIIKAYTKDYHQKLSSISKKTKNLYLQRREELLSELQELRRMQNLLNATSNSSIQTTKFQLNPRGNNQIMSNGNRNKE